MPTELPDLHCHVTFHLRNQDALDRLIIRAREIDMNDEMGAGISPENMPESYTIPQALQVVFHCDPVWLYQNEILNGWTIDEAMDENGRWQNVWGDAPRPMPDLTDTPAVEAWLDE